MNEIVEFLVILLKIALMGIVAGGAVCSGFEAVGLIRGLWRRGTGVTLHSAHVGTEAFRFAKNRQGQIIWIERDFACERAEGDHGKS